MPLPSPGDLPDLGIELASAALAGGIFTTEPPGKSSFLLLLNYKSGFLDSSVGEESAYNAGDPGSIPGSGRSAGEGIGYPLQCSWAFLVAQLVNVGDLGSTPGLVRSPGEGKGYPLQYSGLESSMDCIGHGVAKSWT